MTGTKPTISVGGTEGKRITCPNCNAPLKVSGDREVQTQVCEYCGAQNDLTGTEVKVLGINPEIYDSAFSFEVGQAGTFHGKRYEVCGRMFYEDEAGWSYQAREYLLYNPDEGYLWLTEENGHFILNRPTQQAPPYDPFRMVPKQWVTIGSSKFQFHEWGTSQLVYVDGALPWQAATGDTIHFADFVAPPQMYGVVESEGQVEYFLGWYIPPEDVYSAFAIKEAVPAAYVG